MWKDPIVEEVRETRRQLLAEFNNDFDAYVRHMMREQEKLGDRLVRAAPSTASSQESPGTGK